jgi:hypothetical protein
MAARIPPGGKLYVLNGIYVVLYDVGHGIRVYYDFSAPGTMQQVDVGAYGPAQTISPDEFYRTPGLIHGGVVQEVLGITQPTFQDWFDKTISTATAGASWAHDPEMRSIYADWVVNPQVSADEIQARIRQTNYWKSQTDAQRNFNDASPAEQARLVNEAAADLAERYFQLTGTTVDLANPELRGWAQQVASGAQGAGWIVEQFIKPLALQNPESPWSRTVRSEHEQQRQRGVDVENRAEQVRQLYRRWAIPVSDEVARQWALDITANLKSDADLIQQLQQQAAVLYPWKDPQMETMVAAEPWMATYSRVLERPMPDIFDPVLQQALTSGAPVYQFEQDLKRRPEWLQTKNAKESLSTAAFQLGRLMGFE